MLTVAFIDWDVTSYTGLEVDDIISSHKWEKHTNNHDYFICKCGVVLHRNTIYPGGRAVMCQYSEEEHIVADIIC